MKGLVEREYEKYLKANDTVKVINGEKFYKTVWMDRFKITGLGSIISIVLPYYMFEESSGSNKIENEKGEVFQLHGPVFLRFSERTPEWYFKCGDFYIKESEYDYPLTDIGEYFVPR